jgi:hypothetical protein
MTPFAETLFVIFVALSGFWFGVAYEERRNYGVWWYGALLGVVCGSIAVTLKACTP